MANVKKDYSSFRTDAEIMETYQENPSSAMQEMADKYNDYILYVAHRYFQSYCARELDELKQHGYIGIMRAMKNYKAEAGAFTTYATPYIKNEMSHHTCFLNDESSTYYASVHNSVEKAKKKIESSGNEATVEGVMEITNMSRQIVSREMAIDHTRVSYDSLPERQTEFSVTEKFTVNDMLSCLSQEDATLVKMKVLEGMSFTQIAEKYGVSPYKIRKRYGKCMEKLREYNS